MNIIYAKFNRERLPHLQTVTKIAENDDGSRFVIKEPLTESAATHIKNIYENYEILNADNNINVCKSRLEDNSLFFDIAPGESFEKRLLDKLHSGEISEFSDLLERFNVYLNSMVSRKKSKFTPCDQFLNTFGNFQSDQFFDILDIANIDLIFGNLFIDGDTITQIDYEWVFRFPMLKEYILWRAIHSFYFTHGDDCIMPDENSILEKFGLSNMVPDFEKMETGFQNFVFGEEHIKINLEFRTETCKTFENKINDKNWIIYEREREIEKLNNDIVSLINSIDSLKNSLSWKITKPVRYLGSLLKLK